MTPTKAKDSMQRTALTTEQQQALRTLLAAHKLATETGLFDIMQAECKSPDSINDVCDAAEWIDADEADAGR